MPSRPRRDGTIRRPDVCVTARSLAFEDILTACEFLLLCRAVFLGLIEAANDVDG